MIHYNLFYIKYLSIEMKNFISFKENFVTVHTLLIRYSKNDEIKKTFFLLEKAIC